MAWIVLPLIVALVATTLSAVSARRASSEAHRVDLEVGEVELSLAHGRISSALFAMHATSIAVAVDPDLADSVRQFTSDQEAAVAAERGRIEAVRDAHPQLAPRATAMLDALPTAETEPASQDFLDDLLDFDEVAPNPQSDLAQATLDLASIPTLPLSTLMIDRAVAEGRPDPAGVELSDAYLDARRALDEGLGGGLPLEVDVDLVTDVVRLETHYANAVSTMNALLGSVDELRVVDEWLRTYPEQQGSNPPSSLAYTVTATTALYLRFDLLTTNAIEQRVDQVVLDGADRATNQWVASAVAAFVGLGMAALVAAAFLRRRRELTVLQAQALTDELTGLPNRRAFEEHAAREFGLAEPGRNSLLFHLDLDHFKEINDRLGHAAGDDVLVAFTQRLTSTLDLWRATLPDADIHAGRQGGDEFIVAVHRVTSDQVDPNALKENLRLRTSGPVETVGGPAEISVSVGSATSEPGDNLEALARRSDLDLYDAKQRGRSRPSPRRVDGDRRWIDHVEPANDLPLDPSISSAIDDDFHNRTFVRELIDLTRRYGIDVLATTVMPEPGAVATKVSVQLVVAPLGGTGIVTSMRRRASDLPPPTGLADDGLSAPGGFSDPLNS